MLVDLVVENGRIHTGDPRQPVVNSVAVLNGHIVAAGERLDGLQARARVDARKRAVLPGFNDAHAHTVWFGTTLMEADLSGVGSLDDLYRVVAERAGSTGPDERITPQEAVHAATIGSSRVTGQQAQKGRLVPSQLADMVVPEEHPADVAVRDIHAIPILGTAVGGHFTYR